jgi:pilus assembly protein CpaE
MLQTAMRKQAVIPIQYNSGLISVALITVSLDVKLADDIADSVLKMSWAVHRADCEGYISAAKRPPFPQAVKSSPACIAAIDFDKDIEQACAAASYIQEIFSSRAAIVAMSASRDPDVLLRAMRAGCNEFIGGELDEAAFSEMLVRLYKQWSSKTSRNSALGEVVTFFGAKGGVGTTTLAVHLAMYLVLCHQKKTLLIDSHPQMGHACIYLGIDGSRYHFQELVRNLSRLDSDLLRGYIATHPSGLEVLASPDVCDGSIKAHDPESIAQTLEFLRGEYDYVVIDGPSSLDDTNLAVIDASNILYLVATPEIAAIRDLSRYVDTLSQGERDIEKVKVVINRFSSQHALTVEQIEKAIRLPVAIKLPNGYAEVTRSAILGEPISPKKKTDFSIPIIKWVDAMVGSTKPAEEPAVKKKMFSLWK